MSLRTASTSPAPIRRAGAATAAAAVLVGLGVALAPAASAAVGPSSGPATPELNSAGAWCADGYKIDDVKGETFTFTLAEDADILVLKAATTNYWWSPAGAGTYTVPGQHAISHIIICPADEPADEPTVPADEPTEPADEPTEPADEPTEPADEPTQPSDEPTQPADEPTEPAQPATTPSTSQPAEGATTPAVDEDQPQPQLARTGGADVRTGVLAAAALGLMGAGALAMRAGRRGTHA